MKLKKGMKISLVTIVNGIVTALTKEGNEITLTSSQRKALTSYKNNAKYVENIQKIFSNKDILDEDFKVVKNDKVVFYMK
jgi:hypothetical protein